MSYRKEKLEEQIKRIISELLIREIKDPRIGFATITGVELAKDFSAAKVGISVLGNPRDIRKTLEGIQSATPYIQHRVGKALRIRITPKLTFFPDPSISESTQMVDLLNRLEESERKKEEPSQTEGHHAADEPDDE